MKKPLVAIALLCVVAGIAWYLNSFRQPAVPAETAPVSTNNPPAALPPPPVATIVTSTIPIAIEAAVPPPDVQADIPLAAPKPKALAPPPTAPLTDGVQPFTVLENMRSAVRDYGARFGGNPVGTNPEITRALTGGNPKQVNFIRTDAGLRVSDKGELVDPWGTPWFFHQLAAREMEIRSAGPDRKMWTADDMLAR